MSTVCVVCSWGDQSRTLDLALSVPLILLCDRVSPEYCVGLESSRSVTIRSPSSKHWVTGAFDYWVLNSGLFVLMWEDQSMTLESC